MVLREITQNKLTLVIEVDFISKYYVNEANDIKQVDDDFIFNQLHLLKQANKKGVIVIKLKAITPTEKNKIIENDILWLNRQNSDIKQNAFVTMLSNKHII